MPLFPSDDVEETPSGPVDNQTDSHATTPVYETEDTKANLITEIEGQPWVVDYYNQLLTSGESPKPLDIDLDPTLQQYLHIAAFRLSVTGDLSSDTNEDNDTVVITGEALVYPDTVIPHVGDMFVGKMEVDTTGVFTITRVLRTSFYKKAAYKVEYRLFNEYTPAIKQSLEEKIVDNRYFDRFRLMAGRSPLVSYAHANQVYHYKQSLQRNLDFLYQFFYDRTFKTFVYETDRGACYDLFAVSFFNAMIGRQRRGDRPMPTEYSIPAVPNPLSKPTLWRALIKADPHGLAFLYPRHYGLKSTTSVGREYLYSSISHSNIPVTILPDKWNSVDIQPDEKTYVLSHAFYDKAVTEQSLLERAVWAVLNGERVKDSDINTLLDGLKGQTQGPLFYSLILTTALLVIRISEG